jgi:cytochrome P450
MTVLPSPLFSLTRLAADPYAAYRAWRESGPVCRSPAGAWVVLWFSDVARLWRDSRLSVERPSGFRTGLEDSRGSAAMLNRDAPDHTRMRAAISPVLANGLSRVPELVSRLSRELLAEVQGDSLEVVSQYASPLAFRTLTRLLGVPRTLEVSLQQHCETLVEAVDHWWGKLLDEGAGTPSPASGADGASAHLARFRTAGERVREILSELMADHATAERDGILAHLVRASKENGQLAPEELLEQILLLLMAGHEPVSNLIANTVLALVTWPDQLRELRHDPSLVSNAIAESMRFDSPIQLSRRYAGEDVGVGGHTIPAGSMVILAVGCANRDAARWGSNAEDYDVRRPDAAQNIAFGRGPHHCLGARLAQVEAELALGALLADSSDFSLSAPPTRNGRVNVRGLSSLELRLVRR